MAGCARARRRRRGTAEARGIGEHLGQEAGLPIPGSPSMTRPRTQPPTPRANRRRTASSSVDRPNRRPCRGCVSRTAHHCHRKCGRGTPLPRWLVDRLVGQRLDTQNSPSQPVNATGSAVCSSPGRRARTASPSGGSRLVNVIWIRRSMASRWPCDCSKTSPRAGSPTPRVRVCRDRVQGAVIDHWSA